MFRMNETVNFLYDYKLNIRTVIEISLRNYSLRVKSGILKSDCRKIKFIGVKIGRSFHSLCPLLSASDLF